MSDTSWGSVAEWYDEVLADADSYQNKVILPNILRLVNPKKGQRVIDVGCGQGFFSFELSKGGAEVCGIDVAPELLKIAKVNALKAKTQIKFYESSADKFPADVKSGFFNVAISVLAIQNMENLSLVLANISSSLNKGGKFIMVLNHPCFRIPKKSSWGFDDKENTQFRRVDGYLSESKAEIAMNPSSKKSLTTVSFHRPLQVYAKTLCNNGFAISRIEEWVSHRESEKGPRKEMEDKARREIPLFMCIEAVKL